MPLLSYKVLVTHGRKVLPPRCRNYRIEPATCTVEFHLMAVTDAEAPVAAIIKDPLNVKTTYRWFNGQFFKKANRSKEKWKPCTDINLNGAEEELQDYVQSTSEENANSILVDGRLWEKTSEPVYHLKVHYHLGGDCVEIDAGEAPKKCIAGQPLTHCYLFPATAEPQVLAAAKALRKQIQARQNLHRSRIKILIPEAFTFKPFAPEDPLPHWKEMIIEAIQKLPDDLDAHSYSEDVKTVLKEVEDKINVWRRRNILEPKHVSFL